MEIDLNELDDERFQTNSTLTLPKNLVDDIISLAEKRGLTVETYLKSTINYFEVESEQVSPDFVAQLEKSLQELKPLIMDLGQ